MPDQKLKVCFPICKYYGSGVKNVICKYIEYMPEDLFEIVDDYMLADIVIENLIGSPYRTNLVHPNEHSFSQEVLARLELAEMGLLKVAYIMHCSIIDDEFYKKAFENSIICTGFLDIEPISKVFKDKWLRVPWGVETWDFLLPTRKKEPEYLIYSWGASADSEDEYLFTLYKAVKTVGGKMLHSGYDYKFDDGEHYVYIEPAMENTEIAKRYNMCRFANAMRREDGFELANIEAILSNALPITLNKGSYKYFFSGTSILVREENLLEDLIDVFKTKVDVVPNFMELKVDIINRFNWRKTTKPFWQRVLEEFYVRV